MGKVLRILVILILALGVVAAILAGINFTKREVLIGRTHAMEEMIVKLARTLEAADAPEAPQAAYPQRDLSPVTSREVENPERSTFWDAYNHLLEPTAQPIPTLDYSSNDKRRQLREFYRIDPATGKPEIDNLTGKPATKGPGTMDELLNEVFERAKRQYALLNETRAELPKLRDELVGAIEEINRLKQEGRADKRTIEEKDVRIAALDREKRELDERIARLDEEIRGIRAELQEAQDLATRQEEELKRMNDTVLAQAQQIKDLIGKGNLIPPSGAAPADNMEGAISPGVKGKIVSFNEQWKFAVVEFSDAFMAELLGADRSRAMQQIEVMVKRTGFEGPAGEFVTRLRLRQALPRHNLVVADILVDWQQAPVAVGDEVYF
jgi:hypothetical protein